MYFSELEPQVVHDSFVSQIKRNYIKNGYNVLETKKFDLVVQNNDMTYAIEVVLVNKSKYNSIARIEKLRKMAKKENYKFLVEYCRLEKVKKIDFIELELLLQEAFEKNMPSEFDELSTHTRIDSINIRSLDKLIINKDRTIEVSGFAGVTLDLQWGSEGDLHREDGFEAHEIVEIQFKSIVTNNFQIEDVTINLI